MNLEKIYENYHRGIEWIRNNLKEEYSFIDNYNNESIKWKCKLFLYKSGLSNRPKCLLCNKETKFINFTKGYRIYCSTKCLSNDPSIKNKIISTNIKKYGGISPMNSQEVIDKLKKSIFNKYGVENISQLDSIKKKKEQSQLKNYGYKYNSQRPEIKQRLSIKIKENNNKIQNLQLQKFCDYTQSKLEKYGLKVKYKTMGSFYVIECRKNHTFSIIKDVLSYRIKKNNEICTICNPVIESEKLVFNNKQFIESSNKIHNNQYEYISTYKSSLIEVEIRCKKCNKIFSQTPNAHLRGNGCPYCCRSVSNKETRWLDDLNIPHNIRQIRMTIDGIKYNFDAYDISNNTIYEFYGDYWHGNPEIFKPDMINKTINCSFGSLYEKTIEREELLRSKGFTIKSIWENHYDLKRR